MKSSFSCFRSARDGLVRILLCAAGILLVSILTEAHAATKDEDLPVQIVQLLLTAGKQGDFGNLAVLGQPNADLRLGYCHSDLGGDISLRHLVTLLNEQANGAEIEVNRQPDGGIIETAGWPTEYPFRYFQFTRRQGRWIWIGVCDSSNRMLDFRQRPEAGYSPKLPRLGPRTFVDKDALRDRIQELLQFHHPEALKVYVVRRELVLGQCEGDRQSTQLSVRGNKVSADEVIEFIKSGTLKLPVTESWGWFQRLVERTKAFFVSELKSYAGYEGIPGRPLFEWKTATTFPYVLFWATEIQEKWEWSGVSYCKVPHQRLLFPDDPRTSQDKK